MLHGTRQPEHRTLSLYERCILLGLLAAKHVIEMRHMQRAAKGRRQRMQQVKETEGIGTTGDGNDYLLAIQWQLPGFRRLKDRTSESRGGAS